MNFPHLHLHTKYSILDGAIKPEDLADRLHNMASESKYMNEDKPQVAITDHGNMFGAIDFYKTMKENNIKPIIGIEAYEAYDDDIYKTSYDHQDHRRFHIILLAKNNQGYKNLIKISSKSATDGFYYDPRVDSDLIQQHSEGLIVLSGCLGGRIPQLIMNEEQERAKDRVQEWQDIVGKENFFLEIQWHNQDEDPIVTEGLIDLSKQTDADLVTTGDAHFLDQKQTDIKDYMIAIQKNQPLGEDDDAFIYDDLWVKSPEGIIDNFPDKFKQHAEKGIKNASKIGDMCDVEIDLDTVHMPKYPILDKDQTAETSKEKIWKLIMKGLREEYGNNIPAYALDRVYNEMEVIEGKDYVDYFLVVWDFIEWCKSGTIDDPEDIRYGVGLKTNGEEIEELQGGDIRPGPGRGSAAGSFVSYLIGIINKVHPIKNDLLFERFLNPERSELPDIDIDFPKGKLDKLRTYAELKYGEEYVAQLGTFNNLGARGSIRNVGRIRGESSDDVEELSEKIPEKAKHKFSVKEGLGEYDGPAKNKELKELYENNDNFKEWLDISKEIEGMVQSKGVHAGGVLISPKKINEYIPLWKDGTTQYDMYSAEDVGAVKFDFLGLKTLDIIQKSLQKVKDFEGKDMTFEDIPSYDKDAYDLIGQGKTKGLFQINKDDCAELAKRIKPSNFDELAAITALYRPGPLEAGYDDKFVNRLHGREEVKYPHEDVSDILEPTYGLMIYQEQVMKICQRLAGYSLAEADKMRKAIGKKREDIMEKQKKKFIRGCVDNSYTKELAKNVWEDIEGFADYGFNRCLTGDTKIIDSETGKMVEIADIYKGDKNVEKTPSLNENNFKIENKKIKNVYNNGVKNVYKITTSSGREIKATEGHKFFKFDGWKKLSNINKGDRIAVPNKLENKSDNIKEYKIEILGQLIAEGNLCHPSQIYFYSGNNTYRQEFIKNAEKFENTQARKVKRDDKVREISTKRVDIKEKQGLFEWVDELGLHNKTAREKFIPDFIYELSEKQIELLLARMWEGDGHINENKNELHYATSSKELAYDVQTLLLKLNIISSVRTKQFKYRGDYKTGYQVDMTNQENRKKFRDKIASNFILKSEKEKINDMVKRNKRTNNKGRGGNDIIPINIKNKVRDIKEKEGFTWPELSEEADINTRSFRPTTPGKNGYKYKTIEKISDTVESDELEKYVLGDVYWDKVKSVEHLGKEETYDLEIKDNHNFIANNIFTHNSHAASYGRVAAETAYLKAHHEECFISAALTVEEDRDDRAKIIRQYQEEEGKKIKLPDINESCVEFMPLEKGVISHGLDSVKSVKTKAAREIERERKENGSYEDISDFCLRVDRIVDKGTLRALGEVGAFTSIGLSRADVKENLDEINAKVKSESVEDNEQQSLFSDDQAPVTVDLKETEDWGNEEKIEKEVKRLGFAQYDKLISGDLNKRIEAISEVKLDDIHDMNTGSKVVLVAFIEELWEHIDRNNNTMAFVNIADETDINRVTIFSKKYEDLHDEIEEHNFGIFLCKVDEFRDDKTLNLKHFSTFHDIDDDVQEAIDSKYWKTNTPS